MKYLLVFTLAATPLVIFATLGFVDLARGRQDDRAAPPISPDEREAHARSARAVQAEIAGDLPLVRQLGEIDPLASVFPRSTTASETSAPARATVRAWRRLDASREAIAAYLAIDRRSAEAEMQGLCLMRDGFASGDSPLRPIVLEDLRAAEPRLNATWQRARRQFYARQYDDAIRGYTEFLQRAGENSHAYHQRGLAHGFKGDFAPAVRDFTAALAINPNDAASYFGRAAALFGTGEFHAALADVKQSIELEPLSAKSHELRGRCLAELNEPSRAAGAFTAATRIDPDYVSAYRRLAVIQRLQGHYDEAIAAYNQIIARQPMDAAAFLGRGETHARRAAGSSAENQADRQAMEADFAQALELATDRQRPRFQSRIDLYKTQPSTQP